MTQDALKQIPTRALSAMRVRSDGRHARVGVRDRACGVPSCTRTGTWRRERDAFQQASRAPAHQPQHSALPALPLFPPALLSPARVRHLRPPTCSAVNRFSGLNCSRLSSMSSAVLRQAHGTGQGGWSRRAPGMSDPSEGVAMRARREERQEVVSQVKIRKHVHH